MGDLRTTYELFLDTGQGPPAFEPILARDELELIAAVRRLLAERRARAIEVCRLGKPIFTLAG